MVRIALVAGLLTLAGCDAKKPLTFPPPTQKCLLVPPEMDPQGGVPFRVETVVTGLEVPWSMAFLPGGDILVTERPGRVRLVTQGALVAQPVVTVDVVDDGESGLLGLALSPRFDEDRLFYVYGTFAAKPPVPAKRPTFGAAAPESPTRENRVLRYRLSPDHLAAELDRVIYDHVEAAVFHDGGRLRFGPDGMLYIGTGDARKPERAQDMASPNGKLLRLAPDGSIPPDNPFPNNPAFLTGVRNVEAFDWLDPATIVLADHGPSGELGRKGHDEVSTAKKGQNLGWPAIYGCEPKKGQVTPFISWEDATPPGGLAVYTGGKIPDWRGSVLVATLKSKHLHRLVLDKKEPHPLILHEAFLVGDPPRGYGRLRDVVMAPDGDLYITTSNCDGRGACPPDKDRILRITSPM